MSPCFYGVDTPRRSELIAATHSLEEIRKYVGADSLGYLSLDGLLDAVGPRRQHYCTSCYTGQYPVAFPRDENAYLQLTLKLDGTKTPTAGRRTRRRRLVRARRAVALAARVSRRCAAPLSAAAWRDASAQERGPAATSAEELRAAIDHLGDVDYAARSKAGARDSPHARPRRRCRRCCRRSTSTRTASFASGAWCC